MKGPTGDVKRLFAGDDIWASLVKRVCDRACVRLFLWEIMSHCCFLKCFDNLMVIDANKMSFKTPLQILNQFQKF